MSCGEVIYKFPHRHEEFPQECQDCSKRFSADWETLRHWIEAHLVSGMPDQGGPGRYWVPDRAERLFLKLREGDLGLFVKDRRYVGGGVVRTGYQASPNFHHPGRRYSGYIEFNPDTLRVVDPPLQLLGMWPRWGPQLLPPERHSEVVGLVHEIRRGRTTPLIGKS